MTETDIKQIRLYNQYLTHKTDKLTAVRDLCGVQAQFMVNAFHALKIRSSEALPQESWGSGLVKNWTVRGTVHVFAEDDLPLFMHNAGAHLTRPQDIMTGDNCINAERKSMFAELIVKKIGEGVCEREALKEECYKAGMTQTEGLSVFDQWGGTIRNLAEHGFICYKVQEKKAFQLCKPFVPVEEEAAKLELARRYFTNFAPATVKDASYFFGASQAEVKKWLEKLPVISISTGGKTYFYIDRGRTDYPNIPECIFLAGFDQLMLGYFKQQNPFLPEEYIRGIYNLAGIVFPAILLDGTVVGRWKKDKSKLIFTLFKEISKKDSKKITAEAANVFGNIKKTEWIFI